MHDDVIKWNTGEFPAHWPVTRSFDVFFDLCLNKRLSKQAGDLRCHRAHYDVTVMNALSTSESSIGLLTNPTSAQYD